MRAMEPSSGALSGANVTSAVKRSGRWKDTRTGLYPGATTVRMNSVCSFFAGATTLKQPFGSDTLLDATTPAPETDNATSAPETGWPEALRTIPRAHALAQPDPKSAANAHAR